MPPGRKSAAAIAQAQAQQLQYAAHPDQPIQPDSAEIAHLAILAADVIDALPPSLTRSLSDLKELDAVLNASIVSLQAKLNKMYDMMKESSPEAFTPQQRLVMLKELAEEANAIKLGGEDKIRVATGACETIIQHTSQLDLITSLLTSLMPAHLLENLPASTTPHGYPHLFPPYAQSGPHAPKKSDYFPPPHVPTRQAAQAYSHAVNTIQAYQRETPSLAIPRPSSRAIKPASSLANHERSNSGKKRVESSRDNSQKNGDAIPPSPVLPTSRRSFKEDKSYVEEPSPPKRSRKPAQSTQEDKDDSASTSSRDKAEDAAFPAPSGVPDRSGNNSPAPSTSSQRGTKRSTKSNLEKDATVAGGSGAASPATGFKKRAGNGSGSGVGKRNTGPKRKTSMMEDEEDGDFAGDAGVVTPELAATVESGVVDEAVGEDVAFEVVDGDEPKYCYCQKVSYGEMIGCDNENCKMEWFHLGCIGLPAVPKGTWYCDDCQANMAPAPSNKRRKIK